MNKRIVVAFLLLFGALFTFEGTRDGLSLRAVAQEKSSPVSRPPALLGCSFIDTLDDCVQTRFAQTNRVFGLARVYVPYHEGNTRLPFYSQRNTIGLFVPENDQEKEAIAEIEQSGMKMVIYLASRFVLESGPDESQDKDRMFSHAPILGPVALTQSSQKTGWPEALSLWKQTRKAMQNFGGKESAYHYEFSVGAKDFIARPVRAQELCLKCHTPQAYKAYLKYAVNSNGALLRELSVSDQVRQFSVGDPIGVLLYAYTTSAKSNNVKIP